MRKLLLSVCAIVSSAVALATDFPEGMGTIEITEPGTYTASEDRPARVAPIVMDSTKTYELTVNDDTVLEADVSKLDSSARGAPIAVAHSKGLTLAISETALAAANEKGALAKMPYHFSLSDDKKTLYLTAERKGLMLMVR